MRLKDIRMLPVRITRIPEMAELLDAEQAELDLIAVTLKDIIAQSSINTATHTLSRYEKIFDIPYSRGAGIEERRAAIILKFLSRYPMTVKLMEELILFITGCENKVTEYYDDYAFRITIFGETENARYRLLKEYVELMKPAHLAVMYLLVMDTFEILFPQHGMLSRTAYRNSIGGRLGVSNIFWDCGDRWDAENRWDDETKLYVKTRMALRQQVGYTPVTNRYWDCGVPWDNGIQCDRANGTDMLSRSLFRLVSDKKAVQTGSAIFTESAAHKWDMAYTWDGAYNWDSSSIVNQSIL